MTSDEYWRELSSRLGLTRLSPAIGDMALATDQNGTHFLVYDPDVLSPAERKSKLDDVLLDPASFALGY